MVPEENAHSIVQSGISFLRSITEAYGPEEGMQVWENIVHNLDSDVKGKIFFAMITGEYDTLLRLRKVSPTADKIGLIKEVRNITGFGLREAKDLIDELYYGREQTIEMKGMTYAQRQNAIANLRRNGAEI